MVRELNPDERDKVRDFLRLVKETVANPIDGQGWVLVLRRENKECLLALGLQLDYIGEALLSISVEDYCEGPSLDRDQPGELWVFGKYIGGKDVYIKLKLASFGSLRIVRVISFHFAEHELNYPFREEKRGRGEDENQ